MSLYGNKQAPTRKGLLVGHNYNIEGRQAFSDVEFGDAVFYELGDEVNCYNPYANVATSLLDADLVASNVLTTVVTVYAEDGTSSEITVATTFASDHDTTIAAHIASLEAETGISCAAGTDTNSRDFVITNDVNAGVSVESEVTLGASQAGVTVTYSNTVAVFGGIAWLNPRSTRDTEGLYVEGEMVDVVNYGEITVEVTPGLSGIFGKPAYLDIDKESATYLKFNATSGYDTGCIFKTNPMIVEAGTEECAEIEIRGLK